jgi:hypothetical protein
VDHFAAGARLVEHGNIGGEEIGDIANLVDLPTVAVEERQKFGRWGFGFDTATVVTLIAGIACVSTAAGHKSQDGQCEKHLRSENQSTGKLR